MIVGGVNGVDKLFELLDGGCIINVRRNDGGVSGQNIFGEFGLRPNKGVSIRDNKRRRIE